MCYVMTKLIISEKPKVAVRIANALGNAQKKVKNRVPYYELSLKGERIIIVPAVGHVFGVKQKSNTWGYPVFDVEWAPSYEVNKKAAYTKNYIKNIKELSKGVDEFINACDYDIEGSVIGFNIIKFVCNAQKNKIKRMKFSTLTFEELKSSFEHLMQFDEGLTEAGITRHVLDWYYGINISRALTMSVRKAGMNKILSTGRVQGPALKILAEREIQIKKFKSTPFWQVEASFEKFKALYENEKILKKAEAEKIVLDCKGQNAIVKGVEKREYKQLPPTPFNLTDLQVEVQRLFGITPRETQQIAQNLYEAALISYPRTSSQKLPLSLGLKSIIERLSKIKQYSGLCIILLQKKMLKPHEGEKIDEAHPAIYPTGEEAKGLNEKEKKIYDLIVKRFLAVFGEAAIRENLKVELLIKQYVFKASGNRTIEKGWHFFYEPYVRLKEDVLPELKEGQMIKVKKIALLEKETQPPARYTQASIIKLLESKNLGTKATRAEIINNLYERGYLIEKNIVVTELGLKVVSTLQKYSPDVLSKELTRRFENEMDRIIEGEETQEKVLKEAEQALEKISNDFKEHEREIGHGLLESVKEASNNLNTVGKCSKCNIGELKIMRSRNGGQFVGCSSYPKCSNIYPLPRVGLIKKTEKICEKCNTPIVQIIRKGRKPWLMCLDTKCETKKGWNSNK